MLLKASLLLGMLQVTILGWEAVPIASPPQTCAYVRHGAETSRFLSVVDRVYDSLQAAVLRAHPNRASDYATTCFAVDDSPGNYVRLIERQRHVQLAPSIAASYYKRMGEWGIVRVVRFRSAADAQRCAAAIEEARAWAHTRPYNPEFIEPLRIHSRPLICGPFLVDMFNGARCCPDLHMEYEEFSGRFYEALRAVKQ